MKRQHKKKDQLSVIINLRVTPDMFRKLDKLAWGVGTTMSQLIRSTLEMRVKDQ